MAHSNRWYIHMAQTQWHIHLKSILCIWMLEHLIYFVHILFAIRYAVYYVLTRWVVLPLPSVLFSSVFMLSALVCSINVPYNCTIEYHMEWNIVCYIWLSYMSWLHKWMSYIIIGQSICISYVSGWITSKWTLSLSLSRPVVIRLYVACFCYICYLILLPTKSIFLVEYFVSFLALEGLYFVKQ